MSQKQGRPSSLVVFQCFSKCSGFQVILTTGQRNIGITDCRDSEQKHEHVQDSTMKYLSLKSRYLFQAKLKFAEFAKFLYINGVAVLVMVADYLSVSLNTEFRGSTTNTC